MNAASSAIFILICLIVIKSLCFVEEFSGDTRDNG